jgi:polysaccharide biosynthesis protein PslG
LEATAHAVRHRPGRRPSRAAAAGALVALVLAALALVAPAGASAAAPAGFVGLQGWSQPTEAQLYGLQRSKVSSYRMQVNWAYVQPSRDGDYNWARYDGMFEAAGKRGITILPVLLGSPSWVDDRQQDPPITTTERAEFKQFASAAAARYGPKSSFWTERGLVGTSVGAKYWQVWNEPNLPNYWNSKPNAAQYVTLVKDAHAAVQAGSAKGATTILAGLPYSNAGTYPPDYLTNMFRADPYVYKYFSAAAVHPYAKTPSYAMDYGVRPFRSKLNSLLRGKNVYRDLWVTEIGWATGPADGRFQVHPHRQARNLEEFYNKLLSVRSSWRIKGAFWFSLADYPGADVWAERTGLLESDGQTAKPSWFTLKCVTGVSGCRRY